MPPPAQHDKDLFLLYFMKTSMLFWEKVKRTYINGYYIVIITNRPVGMLGEYVIMDTKSLMIEKATLLFQQKGYKSVGVSEILKACDVTKGALYHHFPNGKEELLIACLKA